VKKPAPNDNEVLIRLHATAVTASVGKNKKSNLKTASKKALKENGKYISADDGLLELRSEYLIQLTELCEAGRTKAVTYRTYPLEQIVEAHRYVDQKHKKNVVIII
jgi:NADPH:quinone reductase-like Zn-dependent oxidoreductase